MATATKQPKPEQVAKARRDGLTWQGVRDKFGVKTSSGAFTKQLSEAGFDAAGVKSGSNQSSKARVRGSSNGSKPSAKSRKGAAKTSGKGKVKSRKVTRSRPS